MGTATKWLVLLLVAVPCQSAIIDPITGFESCFEDRVCRTGDYDYGVDYDQGASDIWEDRFDLDLAACAAACENEETCTGFHWDPNKCETDYDFGRGLVVFPRSKCGSWCDFWYRYSCASTSELDAGEESDHVTCWKAKPTQAPTNAPTDSPTTYRLSISPTDIPTAIPSNAPTDIPTAKPTDRPSSSPSTSAPSLPASTPYDPPELNNTLDIVIEGLDIEAFPNRLERAFMTQFIVFMLLYAALSAHIVREIAHEYHHGCSLARLHNRHKILVTLLLGCVVRMVDLVDLVPSTPLEVEFSLRCLKEILWFTAFALLVHFWIEVQQAMRTKLVNIEKERSRMLLSILAFGLLRVARVFAEFSRDLDAVWITKALCGLYSVAWSIWATTWIIRLRRIILKHTGSKVSRGARRIARFIAAEIMLLVTLLAIWAAALVLQEKNRLSLRADSGFVFALKVMMRLIEWMLLLVLAVTVSNIHRRPMAREEASASTMQSSINDNKDERDRTSSLGMLLRSFRGKFGSGFNSNLEASSEVHMLQTLPPPLASPNVVGLASPMSVEMAKVTSSSNAAAT